ncbi:copper resistance CopC family protein [Aeromicrobium sp. Leaf350]|uniref:copper resistance CopC family protein n=1 Tax=Aeromicrobium sp. Leaf350 TaxID=2876565 RepID=UPI001E5C4CCE|nr:copper resistance CopC family protein [Aeromicrobium sp. Leaf350]
MKNLLRLMAVSLLALLTVLSPMPASAHDTLVEASPAEGSVLGAGDPQVASFRFNNTIFETAAFVAVLDPAGADVSTGEAIVVDDTVTREFAATTPGTYTASYRVTSSDGHPIEGTVSFTWDGPATASPTPGDVPTDDTADERAEAAPGSATEEGRSTGTVALITAAIAVLVVGTAVAISAARRRRRTAGPTDPGDDVD